jgi:DNA-binding transcriptional MocR family regulator
VTDWLPDLGDRGGPRYQALADAITEAITSGALAPGSRLPTHRDLAHRLGLSVHTVSQAYGEVRRRGHIAGETGRGTFVQAPAAESGRHYAADRRQADVIDLSVMRPPRDPAQEAALTRVFADLAADSRHAYMLSCRPIAGLDRHREAGASWLSRMGVGVDRDHVVITNGVAHGLTVALSALVEPGDTVATESLTDHGVIALSSVLHFRLQGLETDAEGLRADALDAACRRHGLKAVVVTPNATNPTTHMMSARRRQQIAAVARRHDLTVVEDDVYGALFPDRPPPIWRFAPERTCYLTSLTKVTVPGLRVGFLVASEPLRLRVLARIRATSWMATPLPAEIAARWLADGTLQTLVAQQRAALGRRNALAAQALGGQALGGQALGSPALAQHATGLHAWLELPRPWRAENFVSQLRLRGIAVASSEPFVVGRSAEPHAVRLCLGGPDGEDELTRGLERIRDVLAMGPEPAFLDV